MGAIAKGIALKNYLKKNVSFNEYGVSNPKTWKVGKSKAIWFKDTGKNRNINTAISHVAQQTAGAKVWVKASSARGINSKRCMIWQAKRK